MEVILFMFVRSLRGSNFDLFLRSLEDMLPWLKTLDHIHYVRWLPIFLHDMKNLPTQVLKQFLEGHFTIKKTNRNFSAIGIDQAHEQNNKIVKTDGGAIGILDDENALLEWAISGPYISEMLKSSLNKITDCNNFVDHHEDTNIFEQKFRQHRKLLIESFQVEHN